MGFFELKFSEDKEIDIVVDNVKGKILIESKYRKQAKLHIDSELSRLASEASAAYVITKRTDDCGIQYSEGGKPILRIPAFAFLCLIGHAEKNGASEILLRQ